MKPVEAHIHRFLRTLCKTPYNRTIRINDVFSNILELSLKNHDLNLDIILSPLIFTLAEHKQTSITKVREHMFNHANHEIRNFTNSSKTAKRLSFPSIEGERRKKKRELDTQKNYQPRQNCFLFSKTCVFNSCLYDSFDAIHFRF